MINNHNIFQNSINSQNIQSSMNSKKMTDRQYFGSLQHYKPLFYSGLGSPTFLQNQEWYKSLICVMIFNGIFLFGLLIFLLSENTQSNKSFNDNSYIEKKHLMLRHQYINSIQYTKSSKDNLIIIIISLLIFILINVSYFLCQFMNPGIRNPAMITDLQFEESGKIFCQHCQNVKTNEMSHCRECKVCVWGLDHHCGFFNKCIAGWQKWAFYAFIIGLFGGFVMIIMFLGLAINF